MDRDPIERFIDLFQRANERESSDATAVALATVDAGGRPTARMVLLKQIDQRGFVFYTNYESRKGLELAVNPQAALCFHWPALGRQVRVEGPVEKVTVAESDAYFASRSRGSQIGSWTSNQSAPLTSRAELVARYLSLQARYAGRRVPRPPHWGGYRLRPAYMEFWSSQEYRLHDRIAYSRSESGWRAQRLCP
jgi:pyridoxamine 5'-phosphate oxidase